ncbi:hypothetical protein [Nocardia sp. NBC_00511]|uniref:hypothetical protein n=1 Tax=Nocardia sp. NBC_00511 TaxID=2903591 RepID=UPI0030DF6519
MGDVSADRSNYWAGATLALILGFGAQLAIGMVVAQWLSDESWWCWLAAAVGAPIWLVLRRMKSDVPRGVAVGFLTNSLVLLPLAVASSLIVPR